MPEQLLSSQVTKVLETMLKDLHEFYFGMNRPEYLADITYVMMGSVPEQREALSIHHILNLDEPGTVANLQENAMGKFSLLRGFNKAHQEDRLCCLDEMLEHGVGMGCAYDIDYIIQCALYGEVKYG